jgi:eukaryotic-like serine/threonine-protein kinase
MAEGLTPRMVPRRPPQGRLGSWKEIASYLGREVRTVQRWEKNDGLPVHRLFHSKRGSVYALPEELDQWLESRRFAMVDASDENAVESQPTDQPDHALDPEAAPPRRSFPRWTIPAIGALLLAGAISGWMFRNGYGTRQVQVSSMTNFPGDEETPSLSWDGRQGAFSWNGVDGQNYDIYVSSVDLGGIKRLTSAPEWDFSPSWSPTEDLIACLRVSGPSRVQILIVSPDGSPERKVGEVMTIGATLALKRSGLTWTPDGKWLIVSGSDSDEAEGLLLMPASGGPMRRLTLPPKGQYDLEPAISPDGKTLVFRREVSFSVSELYLMELRSDYLPAGPERPLNATPDVRVGSPTWETARTLLYLSKGRLMRATIDASQTSRKAPQDVTPPYDNCGMITIDAKPTQAGMVLASCEHSAPSVWRLDLSQDPSAASRRTRVVAAEGSALSPDKKRVAYESYVEFGPNVWIANVDGTNARRLTAGRGAVFGSPAWSPDGHQIAFDSTAEGHGNIYTMAADGSQVRRLTGRRADHNIPAWSRDGKWIYFATNMSGRFEVARMPAAGGEITEITHGGGTASAESPDGRFVYYIHRTQDAWSLRRCHWNGDDDREVIPRLMNRAFAVGKEEIYFIPMPGADGRSSIRRLDTRTGETKTVTSIQKPMERPVMLADDGSFLLFSQYDQWGRDLVVLRNLK